MVVTLDGAQQPGGHLDPIPISTLTTESGYVARELREKATRRRSLLKLAVAALVDRPGQRVVLLGCPDDDIVPVLWGLQEIVGAAYPTADLTFSTYDPRPLDSRDAPRIVFLPERPETYTIRTSVDLRSSRLSWRVAPQTVAWVNQAMEEFGRADRKGVGARPMPTAQLERSPTPTGRKLPLSSQPRFDGATRLDPVGPTLPPHPRDTEANRGIRGVINDLLHGRDSDGTSLDAYHRPPRLPTLPPEADETAEERPATATVQPGWYTEAGTSRTWLGWDGQQWDGRRWEAPSSVFVSYCRSDEDAVRLLVADLRAARLPVWFDEELATGEVWWEEILGRIRDAAVFVHALSDGAVRSEPCRAERAYADALGIPVVPVLVADVDMRSSQHGRQHAVDYRQPNRTRTARLVADVLAGTDQRGPLPSPLPEPPDAPFDYVRRLAETLDAPSLTYEDQMRLLNELITRLRDPADLAVQVAVRELVRKLLHRHDVAHAVAGTAKVTLDSAD